MEHTFYDYKGEKMQASQFERVTITKEHSKHGTLEFETFVPVDLGSLESYIGMAIAKAWLVDKFKIAARSAFCAMFEREEGAISIEDAASAMLYFNPFERPTKNSTGSKVNMAVAGIKLAHRIEDVKKAMKAIALVGEEAAREIFSKDVVEAAITELEQESK